MWCAGRRFDAWLIVTSLVAWLLLTLTWRDVTPPGFCSASLRISLSDSFRLAFALNSPAQLASGCLLMLAAMTPLIAAPLRHVRERTFARRRTRATLLFVIGYGAVWMIAGMGLQFIALAAQTAASNALMWLALSAAAAMLWQISPAKQWCLNRCHRHPPLAASGAPADRAAFDFGLSHGASCVGACWALMLLPLFAGQGHVLTMLAVVLFALAERLESAAPLAWRWRGPGKALRIIAARARMHLVPRCAGFVGSHMSGIAALSATSRGSNGSVVPIRLVTYAYPVPVSGSAKAKDPPAPGCPNEVG
jgi:predicted metal-binding membrane protein